MSKIAFIYPGQGAQKAGMGADFYENSVIAGKMFDEAGEVLQLDMKALCFEENDKLDVTEYTQAALVTTCLAMTRVAEDKGLKPNITAGLSLGEYCAIAAAGGMDDMDAIRLVRKRGILMQNTVPAGEGAMCAVMAMDASAIEKVIEAIDGVTIANYNCPGQIVITGRTDAVGEAAEKLKEAGAKRAIMLNVSGPFHSPLLYGAGEQLQKELGKITFNKIQIPYIANLTAEYVTDSKEIPELLRKQVYSPVRFEQTLQKLITDGFDTFIEIGPGRTLTGFVKKTAKEMQCEGITCINIEKEEDLSQLITE